jgi:trehalose 6-phosphate synthase
MLNKLDSSLLARGAVPFDAPNWLQTLNRLLSPAAWRRPDPPSRAPLGVEPDAPANDIKVKWSPAALRRLLEEELPGADVIVVSNREPYIHNRNPDGGITLQMPASGLVSALEPITRACGGTWIAHGSGSADADVVDRQDRIAVPPDDPSYALRRIWLSDAEQDGYYYGLANEGLWPLCHLAYVRPEFRQEDWVQYVAVNRKFADAVIAEARSESPVVLVQDYHFALLPRMIRERLPNATIITFWHIPWPNPEVFGICPWRDEILDGLLGSTVMAFHTPAHCHNFIDCVDRYLESRIDREQSTITRGGATTCIRPYPISIEWPPRALRQQPTIAECRRLVREQLNLPGDIVMAVGVERFDFTKGIVERFRAVEDLLERHPGWRERFVFVQVAAPTRTKLAAYQQLEAETRALVDAINRRFGTATWQPIVLLARHHEPDEVFTLFRAADACVVSSLHDGMNLVAKEFIAARDDEEGVLILSTFAGAAAELIDAVAINPYDTAGTADGIDFALRMPKSEQRHRMALMRGLVAEHNVYRWAGRMLLDAAKLRRHSRIG